MKQYQPLIAAVILAALTSPALAEFDYPGRVYSSKYKPGDCITPTDQAHAFYGHYARVEGVLDSEKTSEPGVYVLWFPVYQSRTNLYGIGIEEKSQKVSDDFCVRQQVGE